jgi:hypothetical protein
VCVCVWVQCVVGLGRVTWPAVAASRISITAVCPRPCASWRAVSPSCHTYQSPHKQTHHSELVSQTSAHQPHTPPPPLPSLPSLLTFPFTATSAPCSRRTRTASILLLTAAKRRGVTPSCNTQHNTQSTHIHCQWVGVCVVCVVLCGSVEGGCVVLVCVHIYSIYSYMQFHDQKIWKYCVVDVVYIVFCIYIYV